MSKLGINIRVKTILITTTALLMLLGLISWAVWDSFERKALQIETENTREKIDQVSAALDQQMSELGAIALSHATGDDLYLLTEDDDLAALSARFNEGRFEALQLNFMAVVDAKGQVIFGKRSGGEDTGLRGLSPEMSTWVKTHANRFSSTGDKGTAAGLVNLEGETLLVAGCPILPSGGNGSSAGILVIGRTWGDDFLGQVESEVGATLAVQPVSSLSPSQQETFERAVFSPESLVIPLDAGTVQGAAVLSDLDKQPALLLTVSQPRRIYGEVIESRKALIGAMALIWAFVMAGAVLLLDRLVLHPMDQLNKDVAKIGAEGDFSMRLNRMGQDELTSLANAIDDLLNALEKTTQQQRRAEIELQNQLRSTMLLNRVIMAATAAKETKEILSTICMEMAQTFDIPQAAVALMNDHQTGLDVVAEYAADGRPLAEGFHISLAENEATEEAIRTTQPVIVLDAQNDPRVKGFQSFARERGTVTLLIVPLVVRGKVVGTMGLDAIDQRKFTSEDIKLVQNVAGTVSQVLETTELYGELRQKLEQQQQIDAILQRRERILEATVRVQRDLMEVDSRKDMIPSVLATLGEAIEADRAIYYVNENRADETRIAIRRGEWQADADVRIQAPQQLDWEQFLIRFRAALENGELVNLAMRDLPATEQVSWNAFGVQQVLILPAVSEGVLTGFIIFTHDRPEEQWDSGDMTQLQVAAASVALAVERWNAERASEQINHELEMQRDFALQVMTTMGQGLVVTSSDGSFEFVNPAFSRMIKKKPEQLIGSHLDDVVAPIDQFALKKDSRQLKKGKIVHTEMQLKRSDGTFMPVLLTGVPYWRDDRVTGVIAVITDLTEQRHTEDVLRKSETKYRSVVESVQEVIFQTGVTGRWAFLNPAWTEITGLAVDESVGIAFYDFFFEPDRTRVLEQFEHLIAMENSECRFEARILSGEGGYRWVDFYARTNLDSKGQPIGISGTMTDITERKKAEYALRKSEESIRALYNITSNPQMNFSQKVQALLVMGAQHFGTPLGILARVEGDAYVAQEVYSRDENLSRGIRYSLSQTYTQQVMETGQPVVFQRAKGSKWETHPCYQTYGLETYLGTPVVVDNHLYGALNFFGKDAHEEPFTTADMEFLRLMAQWVGSELEQEQYTVQLQAYTAEISEKNTALVEARDQAVEASRMKSEFLATMSHEIRTPMNAVIGMTEMLMDTPLNAAQADYAGTVRDSAQVLLALINDILDFSKIEAGKLELESIPLDVRKEVESAAGLFAARVHEKGLALMELVEPDIPAWLAGDPIRLRQVLFNLVGNAVKFTDQGEIRIHVEQISGDADAVTLRFTVADTGIGLSATARKRLFQPFTQADGSTTRKYGGTGLGLAISKSLVTLMKGEIGVESEAGKGSTFWFTARFARANAPDTTPQGPVPARTLDGLRALVLDDHPFQREIFHKYLQSWKMKVEEAETAAEARAALQKAADEGTPFHFALIDQVLPDGDGLSLGVEIQADSKYGAPHLTLVTAFDTRGLGENAVKEGFAAFILKPVKQNALKETLLNAMNGAAEAGMSEAPRNESPKPAIETRFAGSDGRGLVLLAEDNAVNRKLAVMQLEKLGFHAETVETGRQALEAVSAAPDRYCLVLMDCQMPEMDGYTSTRLIRRMERQTGKHVPVVAMTANSMQGDRDECLAAGMDDYICKPVNMEHLREALTRWAAAGTGEKVCEDGKADTSTATLDRQVLADIRQLQQENDSGFLAGLIDLYSRDGQVYLAKMREAVHAQNPKELQRAAHSLKGSSLNLGARIMGVYCAEMEDCANQEDWQAALVWMDRVAEEFGRVCDALEGERKT